MTLTTSPHPDLPQLRFPADLRLTPDQFELYVLKPGRSA